MDAVSWLLFGLMLISLGNLAVALVWLRTWKNFEKEMRDNHESLKRLLLRNFSDLFERLQDKSRFDEREPRQADATSTRGSDT